MTTATQDGTTEGTATRLPRLLPPSSKQAEDWYAHVSFAGDVIRLEDDPQLQGIDQLARRYTGKPFWNRNAKRVNAWIEPRAWHVWELDRV